MNSAEKPPVDVGGRTYLTINQAVARTSLSRSKLYSMMEAGELSYCKVGRCRRIALDDLMRVMEAGKVPARA
jgi:excisionase family DNA binding protein